MLNNISWTDFIMAVGIALIIYYLFVGAKYYAGDIKELLSGKRKLKLKPALSTVNEIPDNEDIETVEQEMNGFENETDDEFAELEQLIGRLKETVKDASGRNVVPEEFRQYLAMILKEYPSIKDSSLRESVNELIVSECQKYRTVELNEDEVDMLW